LERLSLPGILLLTLRVAAVVAVLVVLWQRFKDRTGEPARMIELGPVALIGAFLAATFTWTYYGLFLLPRHLGSHAAFLDALVDLLGRCLLRSYFGRLEDGDVRLPNLGNDLVSGMFAFGLAIFLCSIWVHFS
jgi:hypothetical protein